MNPLSGHKQTTPSGHKQDVPIELPNNNPSAPNMISMPKILFWRPQTLANIEGQYVPWSFVCMCNSGIRTSIISQPYLGKFFSKHRVVLIVSASGSNGVGSISPPHVIEDLVTQPSNSTVNCKILVDGISSLDV
jgi:hypothetical protein